MHLVMNSGCVHFCLRLYFEAFNFGMRIMPAGDTDSGILSTCEIVFRCSFYRLFILVRVVCRMTCRDRQAIGNARDTRDNQQGSGKQRL